MKNLWRKTVLAVIGLGLWSQIGGGVALGQTVMSNPSGFQTITLLGASDTLVSLPFLRPAAASAVVSTVSSNVLELTGLPAWETNQFVYQAGVQTNCYFALFTSGGMEGHYFPVTQNTTNQITLDVGDYNLSGVTAGDRVSIHPYWTINTLFADGNGVHGSASAFFRNTEIMIPNFNHAGINPSAAKTYYYLTNASGGSWRLYGQSGDHGDDVLLPDVYLIVRHNVDVDTTLTISGKAVCSKWAIGLSTAAGSKVDNVIGLPRPDDVTLNDSGLISSGAFQPSTSRFIRADELLVFDNTVKQKNKSAAATYYYFNGMWQKYPLTADAGGDQPFKAGNGVIIRKARGGAATVWVNTPNY